MKYRLFFTICLLTGVLAHAQAPEGYYDNASNKKGAELRNALHTIINEHSPLSYSALWDVFYASDARTDNGKVWDIYSDDPVNGAHYYYTFGVGQCGNYSSEGDCYNREHSIPKSWFDDEAPMYTDLFHIYPTDGYVNGQRGNLPYGEVGTPSWTSTNGSKVGNCTTTGYSNPVFEPIDAYKGDLARSYFYFTVCYKDKNLGQESQSMFNGGDLKPWALDMLIRWHNNDPVSQKERTRNNVIYNFQGNRNPFIDHPELVGLIYGSDSVNVFNPTGVANFEQEERWLLYPNPVRAYVTVIPPSENDEPALLQVMTLTGQVLLQENTSLNEIIRMNLTDVAPGAYILRIQTDRFHVVKKIIKN